MRELFTAPEAEVVTFAAQDIVTTSPETDEGDSNMGDTDWE